MAAKKLEHLFDVTFIDNKEYFEFTPSVPRTLVNPNHVNVIQIKHATYLDLKKTEILKDKAVKIDKKTVWTKGGKKLEFDVLLICTGSTYNKPFKAKNLLKAVVRKLSR